MARQPRRRRPTAAEGLSEVEQVRKKRGGITSLASPRKRGPIRRILAFGCCGSSLLQQRAPVVMGPGVRRDDPMINLVFSSLRLCYRRCLQRGANVTRKFLGVVIGPEMN